MYRGKHELPRKERKSKKLHILMVSLLLVAVIGVGATVAFLMDVTDAVVNVFNPVQVSCLVSEKFDGKVKEKIGVKNTSDIDAFLRAAVIVNWVDGQGNVVPKPDGYSYSYSYKNTNNYNTADWTKIGEYYYYNTDVAPGDTTENLFDEVKPVYPDSNPTYYLQVEVLAEAIQAEPLDAVQEAWGVTISGGSVTEYAGGDA